MKIQVDCPQCGGDIVFDEEIEVVRCPYCSSTNQITGKSGLPRFMLPPRWTEAQCRHRISTLLKNKNLLRLKKKGLLLVYAPYWRITGMVFHWVLGKKYIVSKIGARSWDDAKEFKTRLFDFSFPAYREPDLDLLTLGVRTSAIPLQLFHHSRLSGTEIVLPAEISLQEAKTHSNSFLTHGFSNRNFKVEFEDTQLVGEVYSIVYFPFWVLEVGAKDKRGLLVIDGVANRISKTVWNQDVASFFQERTPSEAAVDFGDLQLFSFTCPVCGWDLPFAPKSKIHICPTCTRAWAEQYGSYKEIDYQLVAVPGRFEHAIRYMPFWDLKTQININDEVLRTRSDLRNLLPNFQSGKKGAKSSESIHFCIPAFKIRDIKSLSRLATLFCLSPPEQEFRAKERLEKETFEAVYLAGAEVKEMARGALISMVPRYHRRARKLLKDARVEAGRHRLIYYPFYRKGLYFREANSNHAIQRGTVVLSTD